MKRLVAMSGTLALAACAPNLYSLPFYTSTNVHNGPALRFLKEGGPRAVGGAGPSLNVKDPFADGRVIAFTASGGGMRATAFTLGVLAELDGVRQDAGGDSALETVDFVSSVSGGSWAVAAMLTARTTDRSRPLADSVPQIEAGFSKLAGAKVKHWAGAFIPAVTGTPAATGGLTFAQVYGSGASRPLPFVYFNASLYPSHSPFVFTPAYLDHYKVRTLGDPASTQRISLQSPDLATIPIGYAATASSAVPGYTSAFAETDLCRGAELPSYCFGNGKRDNLQIMDGGIYDNIGYKTALEVGLADRDRISRVPSTMIMVDSADAEDFQTMPRKGRDGGHFAGIAMASSFPNQNATYDRLADAGFAAAGFDARILLDYSSAAGFDPARHGGYLSDLPALAYFVANDVGCWADDGGWRKGINTLRQPARFGDWRENLSALEKTGKDCVSMNFARTGYLYKTTFKYDPYRFRLNFELGRLVVRMNLDRIRKAVFRTQRASLR